MSAHLRTDRPPSSPSSRAPRSWCTLGGGSACHVARGVVCRVDSAAGDVDQAGRGAVERAEPLRFAAKGDYDGLLKSFSDAMSASVALTFLIVISAICFANADARKCRVRGATAHFLRHATPAGAETGHPGRLLAALGGPCRHR